MGPQTTVEDLSEQVLLVFVAMAIGACCLLGKESSGRFVLLIRRPDVAGVLGNTEKRVHVQIMCQLHSELIANTLLPGVWAGSDMDAHTEQASFKDRRSSRIAVRAWDRRLSHGARGDNRPGRQQLLR